MILMTLLPERWSIYSYTLTSCCTVFHSWDTHLVDHIHHTIYNDFQNAKLVKLMVFFFTLVNQAEDIYSSDL
jgi:hypothetical protein